MLWGNPLFSVRPCAAKIRKLQYCGRFGLRLEYNRSEPSQKTLYSGVYGKDFAPWLRRWLCAA
ncbi:protein of unknown function [Methylocaldum szegediense]|uniref:Transposase n=1 Tax=Methylocaldum szegediense TaxID=73780 RepID=A0ABM9I8L7_9GAMM|nr:protein of unknown function [Methylocaldum szegediense]